MAEDSVAPGQIAMRPEWGAALQALNRLLADTEDTAQVFEIMRALNGPSNRRGYDRLLASPGGGRLAYEAVELSKLLGDDAWLDAMPADSVGAAYRDFVRGEQLSAEGLAGLSQQRLASIEEPHPWAWFGRRTRDVHDIWHVLAGYGRDPLGEACVVAFSYAQTKGPGWALIAVGGAVRAGRAEVARAIWQGYRHGSAAAWLLGEDYEQVLREPLEAARLRLRIRRPTAYEAVPAAARRLG